MNNNRLKILILAQICLINSVLSVELFTYSSTKEQINVIKDQSVQGSWDFKPSNGHTCRPAPTIIEKAESSSRVFTLQNTENSDLTVFFTVKKFDSELMDVEVTQSFTTLKIEESKDITIDYNCKSTIDSQKDTWSRVEMQLSIKKQFDSSPISYDFSLLKICEMPPQKYDYSIFILMAVSIILVAIGAYQIESPIMVEDQEQTQEVSKGHAFLFILGGSFFLVVMFFLYDYLQLVITIMILISSYSAISLLCNELLEKLAEKNNFDNHEFDVPVCGKLNITYFVSALFALAIVITYAFTKNWLLSNFIALCIVMLMFKVIRLPSYFVALLLLGLAFLYDIFWVFYSDRIFGTSVMANVATKVELPMMFYCPKLNPSPIQSCSLIGLGDIVLPGIFVSFCLKFSRKMHSNNQYYITCLSGYILGILLCVICLTVYQSAQPALLYLSPCTLIPVAIHALIKREFHYIWTGLEDVAADQVNLNQPQKETFDSLEMGGDEQQKHKLF